MMRLNDWQLRLEAFMRERMDRVFAWGSNDCALFAADAVQAITGEVVCPELRGHQDARAGLRTARELGGVRGLATHCLGEPIPPALAAIGDVVLMPIGKRQALAVCNGTNALGPGPAGLVAVHMQQALCAWRVG